MKKFKKVPPQVNLVDKEKETLKFWQDHKVFEKTLKGDKNFSFYDGPPFATGLPHYGHLLAGVLKDVVPRYYTMKGYKVERRFGWDCHGLPVEAEVQKKLGLFSRKDVLEFGVDKFNEECRSVVLRYTNEWKETVHRVGRFVDMDRPYHTMDVDFMESVWWVFQQLYKKQMVYEGFKVVPYSVGLGSVLSNFEANQRYEEVQDTAVTVKFKLKDENCFLLAWTTTPWTLPMNAALAVNPKLQYSLVESEGENFVVSEKLVEKLFNQKPYQVLKSFLGQELVGKEYEPVFDFYKHHNCFKVVTAEYVEDSSGTGVVHLAPAFGEEDFNVGKKENLPLFNPVDDDGLYTSEVKWLSGKKVLESDSEVCKYLKHNCLLYKKETYLHSYPFCYRTGTKLMYRAVSSWFVKVESLKEKLVKNNQSTNWQPEHLRDGRFGNWLNQARDWAVSRNRFWGTPLPLWKNQEGEVVCVGSKEELEKLSGVKLSDLHSHHVGHLELKSPSGKSNLKWVGGVLDCWFESGAMPYAQFGYPHKPGSKEKLAEQFPANFVAEGLDQTRGWFYTLMVLGTALFDQSPFKQVVVNGLVLAEDGKKMSKMLKNYPDPKEVLETSGADALRLYLLDSPVVCAEELKFSLKGVQDQVRKNLLRLHNVHSFFSSYANLDNYQPSKELTNSQNPLDKWLLSRLNNLVLKVQEEMEAYNLKNVVPLLSEFVEDLTNTYVRFNRQVFWQKSMPLEKQKAYDTLYYTLLTFSKVLAPFAPFMAEELYQNLSAKEESVHLETFPQFDGSLVDLNLEESVKVMLDLVELGRNYREQVKLKSKVPLLSVEVLHRKPEVLNELKKLENLFKEELNVRSVKYSTEENKYVMWAVKPNFSVLGKKLGSKLKEVSMELSKLSNQQVYDFVFSGKLQLKDCSLHVNELLVSRFKLLDRTEVCFNSSVVMVFDPTVNQEQLLEGQVREVMRKMQEMRKELNLELDQEVSFEVRMSKEFQEFFNNFLSQVKEEVLVKRLEFVEDPQGDMVKNFSDLNLTLALKL